MRPQPSSDERFIPLLSQTIPCKQGKGKGYPKIEERMDTTGPRDKYHLSKNWHVDLTRGTILPAEVTVSVSRHRTW
jgi:hypothetical protein